jgi:hypothetical protein
VFFDKFGTGTLVRTLLLADNIVKKYTNHNYSGIGGDVNVVGNDKIASRCLFSNFTSFKIKFEAVDGSIKEIEVPCKTQGDWNSYDLDLSTYTGVDLLI